MSRHAVVVAGVALVTLIVSFGLFYLTPLRFLPVVEPSIHEINPADFHALYEQDPEQYVFVDVRPASDYEAIHPVGAVNMPLHTLYDERLTLPKSGKTIVLICGGNRSSGVGYGYLEHYGFLNLMRVSGGVSDWQIAGLPVVTSSAVPTGEPL